MAKDPYRYFRVEARELLDGLLQGVLDLEKGASSPEAKARLLRQAHTLKGAARVVKQPEIAELAHTMEGLLSAHAKDGAPLAAEPCSSLLRLFDRIALLLQALDPAVVPQAPVREAVEEPLESVRVDIQEMDALLRGVTDVAVQVGAVRRDLGAADRLRDMTRLLMDQLAERPGEAGRGASAVVNRARSLADELGSELNRFVRGIFTDVERIEGALSEVRDVAHRLRLVPAHSIFPALDRTARDAAQELGTLVDFEAVGGDVRLDAHVLASLRDALMHVVRNAVTHGVEPTAERIAAGKPRRGQVRLTVARDGGRVSFVCRDDGRGIDVDAVRTAAVARGLIEAGAARSLTADEVVALLGTGGLTTSASLTELSGRGIGMDVVRATTARLKGAHAVSSEPRQGTSIELHVPISIASMQSLLVEVDGAAVAIPLDAVRLTLRVKDEDIAYTANRRSILIGDEVIPFLPLERAIGRAGRPTRRCRRAWSAVVVKADSRCVAVGVDRLTGTANIIMRPLSRVVEADPVIAGVSLDADGNPQLVVDPSGLVAVADRDLDRERDEAAPLRAPILIVDDSLTTRMLEQSILESAGYEVELAVCAEEGLAKARTRRYGLFVVDVEMPGMDGFGFVAEIRADAALRDTPAILVTSRDSNEDRRRGDEVGARAYIVKGEFDQGNLLRTIRRLTG